MAKRAAQLCCALVIALSTAVVAGLAGASSPSTSTSTTTTTLPASQRTLYVELPGPFTGCTFLDTNANQSTDAILDLIRPSAFLTNANANLVGSGGAISSAELVSLKPETVTYTISASAKWSDGVAFSGDDLYAWWQRARSIAGVQSDGYRNISSLSVAPGGLSVTAVFSTPYADWNLLFRDIEARGTSGGCDPSALLSRPSLGPYRVLSASSTKVVLVSDPSWHGNSGRFHEIVFGLSDSVSPATQQLFVNYTLNVNKSQVSTLSLHPNVAGRLASSSLVDMLSFSTKGRARSSLIRSALALGINRQQFINSLWGTVTFQTGVGESVLYSQSANNYPGSSGAAPVQQSTTTTVVGAGAATPQGDCLSCANTDLRSAGFTHTREGWLYEGALVQLRLAVGPSDVDQASANLINANWRQLGFVVSEVKVATEEGVALAIRQNAVDAGVYLRPMSSSPSWTARSYVGAAYVDSYATGFSSPSLTALYRSATADFNPTHASTLWANFDQQVLASFWTRPLYTVPSLLEWSNTLQGITNCYLIPGLIDQLPSWTIQSNLNP